MVNHCGNISRQFSVQRGCRQGDPISSFLFIIAVEILALKLRNDANVKGFKVENIEHILELYADDLSIFLEPEEENLRYVMNTISQFF